MRRQRGMFAVGIGAVFAVAAGMAHAQEISALRATPQQAAVNSPVQLLIDFHLQGYANPLCGIEIDFGDGTVRKVRLGENGAQDFPYATAHTYAQAGAYQIAVSGAFVVRGLRSVAPCNGRALNATVTVSQPMPRPAAVQPDVKAAEPSVTGERPQRPRPSEDERQATQRKTPDTLATPPERTSKSPASPMAAQPDPTAKNPKPAPTTPPNKRVGRFILQPSAGETN